MPTSPMTPATKKSTEPADPVLPFTLEFEPAAFSPETQLPLLQSYVGAVTRDGYVLLLGGRSQGLHTFKGGRGNFEEKKSNAEIFLIDPNSGKLWSFDVNQLSPALSAPLQSTDQQAYHEKATDTFYLVGGYGYKADKSDMKTFGCIISFQVEALAKALRESAGVSEIEALFRYGEDPRFAITGGELFCLNNVFYLVGGQVFNGQYSAFGGADYYQVYADEIRMFTLVPGTLEIFSYGEFRTTDPDHPLHRRDGNIIADIDPISGSPRISCYGGVFPPGKIGGYTYPVFIYGPSRVQYDRVAEQKFSQYQCPVITVYEQGAELAATHHTFFGGISHHYYFQTKAQQQIFELATQQGRNDGLPFIADISTFTQYSDGTYREYLHKEPIPGTELVGSSSRFLAAPKLAEQGLAFDNGVIKLGHLPQEQRLLIGYIYGGIRADFPYPEIPNAGTAASNGLYRVYITRKPASVYPGSVGKLAP